MIKKYFRKKRGDLQSFCGGQLTATLIWCPVSEDDNCWIEKDDSTND